MTIVFLPNYLLLKVHGWWSYVFLPYYSMIALVFIYIIFVVIAGCVYVEFSPNLPREYGTGFCPRLNTLCNFDAYKNPFCMSPPINVAFMHGMPCVLVEHSYSCLCARILVVVGISCWRTKTSKLRFNASRRLALEPIWGTAAMKDKLKF